MNRSRVNATNPVPLRHRGIQPAYKILRACVVQSGKVIEEQRLRRRETLSIGYGARNTFVIADSSLPKKHKLFVLRSGQYELVLTENMRGRISVTDQPVDFASLKTQGLLKKRGAYYYLPLTDNHRGKVIVGDVTLIFQFVLPPPVPVKPQLPTASKASLINRIDWPYALALLVVLSLETPLVAYFQFAPKPVKLTLDTIDDRWAKLIAPKLVQQKKEAALTPDKTKEKRAVEKLKEKKKAGQESKDKTKTVKERAVRNAKIRKSIEGRGILAVLGTTGLGAADGAVADVFSEGGIGGDLDSAFEGISGVGLATGKKRSTRGSGSGSRASIGGLATAGGGKVGLEGKRETQVAGTIAAQTPEVDGALDSEAVAKVLRARKRMLQDCYERELKRDPTLSGKIEIECTIGINGRVEEVFVTHNSMHSDMVSNCIVSRIRRWRFPKPDSGNVTVTLPFIFAPSS